MQIEKERGEFLVFSKEYYKHAEEDYEFVHKSVQRYMNVCLLYECSVLIHIRGVKRYSKPDRK